MDTTPMSRSSYIFRGKLTAVGPRSRRGIMQIPREPKTPDHPPSEPLRDTY